MQQVDSLARDMSHGALPIVARPLPGRQDALAANLVQAFRNLIDKGVYIV
jgi:hypothetical protein